MWVSPNPTPRKKISFDFPVDCIPDIKSRLDAAMSSCHSWAAHEGSFCSVFMYFMPSRSTFWIVTLLSFGSDVISFSHSKTAGFRQGLVHGNAVARRRILPRAWTMSMSCDKVTSSRPTKSSTIFFRSILSSTKSSPEGLYFFVSLVLSLLPGLYGKRKIWL